MKYVIIVCSAFLAGAAFGNSGEDPQGPLPIVCKATPLSPAGKLEPNRCWDGAAHRYLMDGYGVVNMEGGFYLVGWPK